MYAIVIEVYPEQRVYPELSRGEGLVVEAGDLAVEFARCPTALDELEHNILHFFWHLGAFLFEYGRCLKLL